MGMQQPRACVGARCCDTSYRRDRNQGSCDVLPCRRHHAGAAKRCAAERDRGLGYMREPVKLDQGERNFSVEKTSGPCRALGDAELDGIEDDLASNIEREERLPHSLRVLQPPQCNRRKQEGASTKLRVQDRGENANEGDHDCQEGHVGTLSGTRRRRPRALLAAGALRRADVASAASPARCASRDYNARTSS